MNKIVKLIVGYFIKPCIIFESKPIFSDNTKAVYDELVCRGYDKEYRLVWFVDYDEFVEIKDNKTLNWNLRDKTIIERKIRRRLLRYSTKCYICCNTFLIPKNNKQISLSNNQLSFYLSHGTPIKSVKDYYTSPGGIDYVVSAAPELNELMSYEFSVPLKRVIALGFPRNDAFTKPKKDLKNVFGDYEKIVIWYPTYRQHKNHSIKLAGSSLPVIHDKNNAAHLNNIAKINNVLIVVKPHLVLKNT